MMPSTHKISSPCVRNCCLDEQDICLGCFRSLDEIKNWSIMTDTQHRQVLQRAQQRQQAMTQMQAKSRLINY